MPVVADFTVIQGDPARRIGDGAQLWEKAFNTGGRRLNGGALLMFMVKGLTATTSDVEVKINNKKVGVIENYNGAHGGHWFTQIINVGGRQLKRGENEIQIEAISFPEAEAGNIFDDFYIKDVVCFFNQSA